MSVDDLQLMITQAVGAAMKPLQDSVNTLQLEITSLRETVEKLSEELADKDQQIQQLETAVKVGLDEREQYSRRNNVRIFGVKEQSNEDTNNLVIDLAKKMGVHLEHYHIDRSHRIGKAGERPRPIIVKFVSYAERSSLFSAKKRLKGTGVTIREDLTKMRMDLLKTAVSHYSNNAVWTIDGVILVKVNKDRPFRVRSDGDLNKLMKNHPPSELQL
ncbi:protein unc-13 homolog C-like [Thrips palmi]|uniref:Protein unc-13 homolog C-like n=1 Tax=Thrips palmi TaxID=161013 RepID=A0A6P8ZHA1_THRPL|nr:protein unc-13 homolog C-like [Thrips palmi]